jgi:hypothetical protein
VLHFAPEFTGIVGKPGDAIAGTIVGVGTVSAQFA